MSGSVCCARCASALATGEALDAGLAESAAHGVDLGTAPTIGAAHPSFEDWQFDQDFRHLQARVGNGKRPDRPVKPAGARAAQKAAWHIHAAHQDIPRPHKPRRHSASRSSGAAWTLLAVGLIAFGLGMALVLRSWIDQRPDLWSLGMPLAAAGQVGLLLGLALMLERVWQNGRDAVRRLDKVDSHLDELERAARLLSVTHGSAAQAFYAHMAEQANPEILLADLKGQLDLLAVSMSKRSA